MSPSALSDLNIQEKSPLGPISHNVHITSAHHVTASKQTEFLLDRDLHKSFPVVKGGKGNYLHLTDGRAIFDSTSGAAVSCLGHGNQRVINAIVAQLNTGAPYMASTFFGAEVVEALCKELIAGTGGRMGRVYLTGSGLSSSERVMTRRELTQVSFRLGSNGSHNQTCSAIFL
jgi:adenosylmethionine-8-amino-7-oxononanoate aminotransferase